MLYTAVSNGMEAGAFLTGQPFLLGKYNYSNP